MTWRYCAPALVWLAAAGAAPAEDAKKTAVPVYTNDDLDRVSPRRGETGVHSEVAPEAPDAGPAERTRTSPAESDPRARAEAFWRGQADQHRRMVERFEDRIRALQGRIEAWEARPPRRRAGALSPIEGWRDQKAVLEERLREAQARFADRARRAGALPGWLR